jgi:hypothetical protein
VPAETLRANEAPPIGVLTALRRHWFVAILPVIVFVGAAIALGTERPPRYTANASLSVGRIFVNNPAGVSGVIEATQSLAAVYSRAISSSAVIKITAESFSEARAVALANAASRALAGYVRREGRTNQDASILDDYQRAVRRHRELVAERRRLQRRYEADPTSANEAARDRADVAISVALLRREALRANYLNLIQGTAATARVETFARATSATSDRRRMLQIMLFLGLVAGVAAGTSFALLRAYSKSRPGARA